MIENNHEPVESEEEGVSAKTLGFKEMKDPIEGIHGVVDKVRGAATWSVEQHIKLFRNDPELANVSDEDLASGVLKGIKEAAERLTLEDILAYTKAVKK